MSEHEKRGVFDASKLPRPESYFQSEGIDAKVHGKWASVLCPFHNDTNPSLRVNMETGAFRCMSCGETGSAILAIHMQRHGLSFKEAAIALGCWDDSEDAPFVVEKTPKDFVVEDLKRLGRHLYQLRSKTFHRQRCETLEIFEAARLEFLGELIDPTPIGSSGHEKSTPAPFEESHDKDERFEEVAKMIVKEMDR